MGSDKWYGYLGVFPDLGCFSKTLRENTESIMHRNFCRTILKGNYTESFTLLQSNLGWEVEGERTRLFKNLNVLRSLITRKLASGLFFIDVGVGSYKHPERGSA